MNTFKSVSGSWSLVILKALDNRLIRPFLGKLPPLTTSGPPDNVRRILVVRPGGLGDALLLLPAMVALRDTYPQGELVILAESRNAQAFSFLPFSCGAVNYASPSQLFSLLIDSSFDLVVDTEQWYGLSALVVRMVRGRFKVGFGTNGRARCFHKIVGYSHHEYEAEAFFRLLEPLGIKPPDWCQVVPLVFQGVHHTHTNPFPSGGEGRALAALFPGASHPARRWGKERFLEVARFLVGEGWKVAVVGGVKEREEGEYISSHLPQEWVLNYTGSSSLMDTAKVLKTCRFLFTADSGIMHLAWLLGVPTLSLFGPGIVEKWAPRGSKHLALRLDLSCSPCTRFGTVPSCPYDFACMRDLTPEMVIEALKGFLRNLGI